MLTVRVNKAQRLLNLHSPSVKDAKISEPPTNVDPILSAVSFSFKVACPALRLRNTEHLLGPRRKEPPRSMCWRRAISFRQLMLDRAGARARTKERNPSISASCSSIRSLTLATISAINKMPPHPKLISALHRRASVRRHARLVDYQMHDRRNARAGVQVCVAANLVKLPKETLAALNESAATRNAHQSTDRNTAASLR